MKKRLLSLVLTLAMVVTLFAGVGVMANAATTYTITLADPVSDGWAVTTGGSYCPNKTSAAEGSYCWVNWTSDEGYVFDAYDIYKTGDPSVKVEFDQDGCFDMPAFDITVKVTFKPQEAVSEDINLQVDWSRFPTLQAGDDLFEAYYASENAQESGETILFADGVGLENGQQFVYLAIKITESVDERYIAETGKSIEALAWNYGWCDNEGNTWLFAEQLGYYYNGVRAHEFPLAAEDELALVCYIYATDAYYFPSDYDYDENINCNAEIIYTEHYDVDCGLFFIEAGSVADIPTLKASAGTDPRCNVYYDYNDAYGSGYTTGGSYGVMPGIAKAGTTITLRTTPDDGYEVDTISIDGVNASDITKVEDNKYTFTMPANHDYIYVDVTFKETSSILPPAEAEDIENLGSDSFSVNETGKVSFNLPEEEGYFYLPIVLPAAYLEGSGITAQQYVEYFMEGTKHSVFDVTDATAFDISDYVTAATLTHGGTGQVYFSNLPAHNDDFNWTISSDSIIAVLKLSNDNMVSKDYGSAENPYFPGTDLKAVYAYGIYGVYAELVEFEGSGYPGEPDGPSAADLSKVEAAKALIEGNLSWIPTESDTAILDWIQRDLIPYAYDDVDYSNVTFAVTDFSVNEATYAAAGELSCTVTITCGTANASLEIKVPMGKLIADLSSWVIRMTEDKLIIDPKNETAEYFIDFTPGPFPLDLYNSLKGKNSPANAEQMGDIDAFYMGNSSFVGRQEFPYMEEGMDLLLVTVDKNIGSGDYRAITGVHAFTFVPSTVTEPEGDSSHDFETDIPNLKVDGLEAEAEKMLEAEKASNPTASEVAVDVKMKVEAKTSNVVDADEKAEIEAIASVQSENLTYIDIAIKKTTTIDGGTPTVEPVNETSSLVTIEIPFDTTGKTDFKVYRHHEGHADGDVQVLATTPNSHGEYITVETGKIIVHAKFFSTYAVGYTLPGSESPSYTHICSNICCVCGGCKNTECGWYVCSSKCNEAENVFADVTEGLWYTDSVKYVYHRELMIGVGNNLFAPDGTTTRAQIITILWRMENCPTVETAEGFNDVFESDWYYNAIRWASANGIAEGYGDSVFGPTDAITREQLATILWRYCKYKGLDVSVGLETNILSYEDAFDVNGWSMDAMQWACGAGMIQGIAKNNTMYLNPQGLATRGQCATIIHRFCVEYKMK